MKIVLATRSRHKIAEIRRILAGLPVELVGLEALPPVPDVIEDRDTFAGNAEKKAREIAAAFGFPVLADDSGLLVDGLPGELGVRSHRFGDPGLDDRGRNALLLERLAGVPFLKRTARYVCVAAFARPGVQDVVLAEGKAEGYIIERERGTGGFGYDPLFWMPSLARTFGEADPAAKDRLSHRGEAFRAMAEKLKLSYRTGS